MGIFFQFVSLVFVVLILGPLFSGELSPLKKTEFEGGMKVKTFRESDFEGKGHSNLMLEELLLKGKTSLLPDLSLSAGVMFMQPEGADEPSGLGLDEAFLSYTPLKNTPFHVELGYLKIPFGLYKSYMVTDSWTKIFGASTATALSVDYEWAGFHLFGFIFKNDAREVGENHLRDWGGKVSYKASFYANVIELGGGLLSSLPRGDATYGRFGMNNVAGAKHLSHHVPATNFYIYYSYNWLDVVFEYLQMMKSFRKDDLAFKEKGAMPQFYTLEAAINFEFLNREGFLAVAYSGSSEAKELEVAASRISVAYGLSLMEYVQGKIEYFRESDYAKTEGGTGKSGDRISLQFVNEF